MAAKLRIATRTAWQFATNLHPPKRPGTPGQPSKRKANHEQSDNYDAR